MNIETQDFEAMVARVREVLGVRTQTQLAEALGIRQSSVSDACRRQSIPDGWLLRLVEEYGSNPVWIRTGEGPRFMLPSDDGEAAATLPRPEPPVAALGLPELHAEIQRRYAERGVHAAVVALPDVDAVQLL